MYLKLWLDDVRFLRYGVQQKDGQTDGWEKWHIEVGAPPYKNFKNVSEEKFPGLGENNKIQQMQIIFLVFFVRIIHVKSWKRTSDIIYFCKIIYDI